MKRSIIWLACLANLVLAAGLMGQTEETLKYEVSVRVRVVPLFAVTANGEPVFDLRADELVFFVNGRKVAPDFLLKREFQTEITEKVEAAPKVPEAVPVNERIVFILLDYFNLNSRSERRLIELTRSIIAMGQPYDRFVVFKMQAQYGLKYIAGPEPKSGKILARIEKSRKIGRIAPASPFADDFSIGGGAGDPTDAELQGNLANLVSNSQNSMKGDDQMNAISYFKHALTLFVQPKVVYYISTGFPLIVDGDNSEFLNLNHIVRSFREGGASVFAINPNRDLADGAHLMQASRHMLTNLAKETGGGYFEGSNVSEVVERVKKSNSAYYEAAINLNQVGAAKEFRLKVECQRPGVQVLVPGSIVESKKYGELSDFEKELFAADAASGGFWARMQTKVKRAPFDCELLSGGDEYKYRLSVHIPVQMAGQAADIHVFRVDAKSGKISSNVSQRSLQESEALDVSGKTGDRVCFAIITRSGAYCICGDFVCGGALDATGR